MTDPWTMNKLVAFSHGSVETEPYFFMLVFVFLSFFGNVAFIAGLYYNYISNF